MDKIYDISFVGQDFQPTDAAVRRAKITCNGKPYYIHKVEDNETVKTELVEGKTPCEECDKCNKCNIDAKGETPCKECNKCDIDAYRSILFKLLSEIAPGGKVSSGILHVNVSEDENKRKNQQILYSQNPGEEEKKGYFAGIVGVIKKQIKISLESENPTEKNPADSYIFNVTLQVKSRLDVDEKGQPAKPYFLSTMLLRDKLQLNDHTVPNSEDELFDYLLLFWFKEQLQEACLKGYYKTYRRFYNNDDRLKGSIDVARHIKLNMGQRNGRIAYTYRENTINNFLNHMIVAAYEHLKKKYYDLVVENFDSNIELKGTIDFLKSEIGYSDINAHTLISKNMKSIAHPFFTEYEQLRIICLKILRDEGISIFDGTSEQETEGILFYLPDLWELYLKDEVLDKGLPNHVTCKTHECVRNFGVLKDDKRYECKQKTYPDYVFYTKTDSNESPFMLLDAKFKPKWEAVLKEDGCKVNEVMEDYNKCLRDMVAINANATGVIFPTNKFVELREMSDIETSRIIKHSISQYNEQSFFYTIPVQVPVVDSDMQYLEWQKGFQEKLNQSISVIKDIVLEEKSFFENTIKLKEEMQKLRKQK